MDIRELRKGSLVRISDSLEGSKTEERFDIDSSGYMLGMRGKVFPIESVSKSENKIEITYREAHRTFLFDSSDVFPPIIEEIEFPKPCFFNPDDLIA